MLKELKKSLEDSLNKQLISPRILLDNLRLIDESSRKSGAYQDPLNFPFYYHLGKYLKPKKLMNFGLRLALNTCCFLRSCKTVEEIFGFEKVGSEFFSPRLAIANIKDLNKKIKINFYFGYLENFISDIKNVDLVLCNDQLDQEEMQKSFEMIWDSLNSDALYVVDYVDSNKNVNNAFKSFCSIVNRNPTFIKTRYGIGIVQK